MTLSPIEKTVLSETGQWRTRSELAADLQPEFALEDIERALDFLQHAGWLEQALYVGGDAGSPQPLYKRTDAGQIVCRRQYRRETAVELARPTRRMFITAGRTS